uniref:Transthyretin n=1 Tax=Dromaius novaehollandiae TaxID=8790 RepID=A0A8C4KKG9_DRONO
FSSEAAPLVSILGLSILLMKKILDSLWGSPAPNFPIKLYKMAADGSWELLNSKQANENEEFHKLTTKERFGLGLNPFHQYADVSIHSLPYFYLQRITTCYMSKHQLIIACVMFTANNAGNQYYIIATLLSPFSYSTTAVVSEPVE